MGSSLRELKQAAEDCGACAQPLEGMTATTLRAARFPILLHVRRPGRGMPYLHWVLFVGEDGGKARIIDPPFSEELLPFAELLALWDGVGLVVSNERVSRAQLLWPSWAEEGLLALFVGVTVGAVWSISRCRVSSIQRRKAGMRLARQGFVLLGLTAFGGLLSAIWHAVQDFGYFDNRPALALVAGHEFDVPVPAIALDQLNHLQQDSSAVLIDARMQNDFKSGHIPGAVSLPVTAGLAERSQVLAGVPTGADVIVYCQSESCKWGEVVAADLVLRGYQRVKVYRGGFQEWQHAHSSKSD